MRSVVTGLLCWASRSSPSGLGEAAPRVTHLDGQGVADSCGEAAEVGAGERDRLQ
jgi:hypothetical protein